ncbi:MAG: alpha/beta hydrolase [Chloroflexi bacterium]|nr:alpha/beta hydrolase [Chloroflexota bacterium]
MVSATKGTEHYVSRPDGKVYYYKVGQGEPLTLLHNMDWSGWIWRKVIGDFAQHFTCYNLDLPGYDHSDIPPRKYSVEDYTKAVLDVLDQTGVKRTNIVAFHGGAFLAVDLAARHPERVNRLVLSGLPFWNKEKGKILWERYFLPSFTDRTSFDIPVEPLSSWEETHQKEPNLTHERWQKKEEIKKRSRRWTALSFQALCEHDAEAAALKIKAPTLILNGEGEQVRRTEEKAKAAIKGSILKVIEGSTGPAHEEKPDEFARLVLDFLLARA